MGAYLSEPKLTKESVDEDDGHHSYGASSMQGWRIDQEDDHNSIFNFDANNTSFFAVYDGHGGAEVAKYCARYMPEFLKSLSEYKNGNLEEALQKLFLNFDASLLSEKAQIELKELAKAATAQEEEGEGDEEEEEEEDDEEEDDEEAEEEEASDDGEEEEEENSNGSEEITSSSSSKKKKKGVKTYDDIEEICSLSEEAQMPIQDVLKRYQNAETLVKNALKKRGINGEAGAGTSSKMKEEAAAEDKNGDNEEKPVASATKASNFQQQEELDMQDIKKNSNVAPGGSQDRYEEQDEASNIGTDSQKSSAPTHAPTLAAVKEEEATPTTPAKTKLHPDEHQLSPIRKSASSEKVAGVNSDNNKENTNQPSPKKTKKKKKIAKVAESGKGGSMPLTNQMLVRLIASAVNERMKKQQQTTPTAPTTKRKSPLRKENGKKAGAPEDDDSDDDEEDDEDFVADEDSSEEEEGDDDDDEDDDNDEDEEEASDEENAEEDGDDEEDEDFYLDAEEASRGGVYGNMPGNDSGCTAVVALLREKKLYVANAGDSRCVVCRNGKAVDMSIDHKPEDDPERERIEKAGGKVTKDGRVNNGLNLSRAIGDHSYKKNTSLSLSEQMITSLPDVRMLDVDPSTDSFMVLACDGIWNFMSSQEVCDYIQERLHNPNYSKLSQICEELFMHCLAPDSDGDGTGCDNMTCIIVTFSSFRGTALKSDKLVSPAKALVDTIKTNGVKRSAAVDENGEVVHANEQKKLKIDDVRA